MSFKINPDTTDIQTLFVLLSSESIYNASRLQGIEISRNTDTLTDNSILIYNSSANQWVYTGYTGSAGNGVTGYTGYTGPAGVGVTGYTGYTGPAGVGATGYTGYTGPAGVGATGPDGAPSNIIYQVNNLSYATEQQRFQSTDIQAGDAFGYSVAINSTGDYAIVGAYLEDTGGSSSGAAYIFTRSGTTWTQQQKIKGSDSVNGDNFGISVAINETGDYVIVGATGIGLNAGGAYIFTRSGTTWTEQQKILSSDIQNGDFFGNAVAINSTGDYVIVGAYLEDTGGSSAGAAYVFNRDGVTWTEQQKIQGSNTSGSDEFGTSVAINSEGDYIIVGAPAKTSDTGSAYVFIRNGVTWTEQQILTASDAATINFYGFSVSINSDGSYVAVGAYGNNDGGTNSGAVYIYLRSNTTWSEQQKLKANVPAASALFGQSVCLNSIGNYIAIGTPGETSNTGSVYIFTLSNGVWTQQQKITASNPSTGDLFGYSTSTSGEYILAGAYNEDTGGTNTGSSYVFKNDILLSKLQNVYIDSTTNDSISLNGVNNLLVKTGIPTLNVYEITLANDLVTGKEVVFYNNSSAGIDVTFVPSVIGWTDTATLNNMNKIRIIYVSENNTWYNIS